MSTTLQMLDAYPGDLGIDQTLLATCIDACLDCAQACTAPAEKPPRVPFIDQMMTSCCLW